MQEQKQKRYQLRQAAGMYWLLDMEQSGCPYRKPVLMNAVGVRIWNRISEGWKTKQIAEELHTVYEIPCHEALADVKQFISQLQAQGII